jgi:tetratricopeptide (TPR) repeat protein
MSVTDTIRAAYAAYGRGDFATARNQGERALKLRPHDPAVLQLLGVVLAQTGEPRRAVEYLRRAIANGGDTPANRLNLAKALAEIGDFDGALHVCAPDGQPPVGDMARMQADILKAQGRATEASYTYEAIVGQNPNDHEAWNNLGNARHAMGDFDGALAAFESARAVKPDSALIHINIARVYQSKEQFPEACLMLEQAALLSPNDPVPLLELGRMLTALDHSGAALRALGTAARLNPRDPEIFVAIGIAFTDLAELQQAERSYRFAIQADPRHAPAYLNLGLLLEKANRIDEVQQLLNAASSAGVVGGDLDYLRALTLSRQGRHADALTLAGAMQADALDESVLAQFQGQLADRMDRPDEAFAAFEAMNRAVATSPMGVGLDREAYQRGIARLAEQTTAAWFESWPVVATDPSARPAPAFLVGFPRSGTTLLDTFLMGHSGTHVLEELPLIEKVATELGDMTRIADLDARGVADLRALYFAELDAASPPPAGAMVIDKNPLSMIRMPLIHRLFPDAKIILAMRHPCDVVLSCYMQNFKATEPMASFFDLANAARTYDRIFAYWEQCRALMPLGVHMSRYEAMIVDPQGEISPLFAFLGLPWEAAALDHQATAKARGYIRTPSYAQVTEKLYSSASGRWTRYRAQMTEVLPILAPWAERYGYALD